MDLFLYDEFTAEESQAVDEGEGMAEMTDQKPTTTIEKDSADLEPAGEDEMTVEEKAEIERIKLETQRTMAAYMEQLRSQMYSYSLTRAHPAYMHTQTPPKIMKTQLFETLITF